MLTRRKAFTTIEILLVVGVLVILIGLVVWGLKGAGSSAAGNSTRTTLQNLTNMLEELNRKNKLAGFEGPPAENPIYPIPPSGIGGEVAPGLVTGDSKNFDRFGPAVHHTADVMRRLSSIPDNKRIMEKFPSDQLLAVPPSGSLAGGTVVLDGWKNPIIFVPASGLSGVMAKRDSNKPPQNTYVPGQNYAKGARVIVDGASWTATTSTSNAPSAPDWYPGIRSPDGRSFWASAGPDGTFGAQSDIKAGSGDDNVYSFEH
jgi:type II secretory pathway pseudopilin PulG